MTKFAAFAVAFAIAFAPAAYAAKAPKTKEACEKVQGYKWDAKAKKCIKEKMQ